MGILDEAIRQHLELKRKHGAAEDDLKRLEDEAFGLPSRPGEPDFPESEEAPEAFADEVEHEAEPPAAEAVEEHPLVEEQPLVEELPVGEALEEEPLTEEAEAEPEPGDEGVEEPPEDQVTAEATAIYDRSGDELDLGELDLELGEEEALVADELAEELEEDEPEELDSPEERDEEETGEDVLADTPDFLRDAPEDDELWFEQGEPKDFDFDE